MKCPGVDTVAQSRRLRSVGKNMAEVRIAAAAHHLYSTHAVAGVLGDGQAFLGDGGIKTGPPGSRIELGPRAEKIVTTRRALEDAPAVKVVIFAGKRRLGSFLAQYTKLLGCENLPPLLFTFMIFGRIIGIFMIDVYFPLIHDRFL